MLLKFQAFRANSPLMFPDVPQKMCSPVYREMFLKILGDVWKQLAEFGARSKFCSKMHFLRARSRCKKVPFPFFRTKNPHWSSYKEQMLRGEIPETVLYFSQRALDLLYCV